VFYQEVEAVWGTGTDNASVLWAREHGTHCYTTTTASDGKDRECRLLSGNAR
jgi:hypothetical protein